MHARFVVPVDLSEQGKAFLDQVALATCGHTECALSNLVQAVMDTLDTDRGLQRQLRDYLVRGFDRSSQKGGDSDAS